MKKKQTVPVVRVDSAEGRALVRRIEAARAARSGAVGRVVAAVIDDVARRGDRALFAYAKKFDGCTLTARTVRLTPDYIAARAALVARPLAATIRQAAMRIRAYHSRQKSNGFTMKTAEGVLGQRVVAVGRAGVYVPAGYTAYPSSVLMNVIPAQVAGVREIAVVTPVRTELDAAIAYALSLLKITEVYRVGGSQAIAALALGTESIPKVDTIVGPGNSYVATAKRLVYGRVNIDSVAGPSEVAIVADTSANPAWVALDMLAQAEHGSGDETAVCITESMAFARALAAQITAQIAASPVRGVLEKLPARALSVFVAPSRAASLDFVNQLAPEHLQIMTRSARRDVRAVRNSGAIFLGHYTPVALGDYFIGTNHVLPTGGGARFASGLGVDTFVKRQSVAEVSRAGLKKAAPHVSLFARAERFVHHALSIEKRIGL